MKKILWMWWIKHQNYVFGRIHLLKEEKKENQEYSIFSFSFSLIIWIPDDTKVDLKVKTKKTTTRRFWFVPEINLYQVIEAPHFTNLFLYLKVKKDKRKGIPSSMLLFDSTSQKKETQNNLENWQSLKKQPYKKQRLVLEKSSTFSPEDQDWITEDFQILKKKRTTFQPQHQNKPQFWMKWINFQYFHDWWWRNFSSVNWAAKSSPFFWHIKQLTTKARSPEDIVDNFSQRRKSAFSWYSLHFLLYSVAMKGLLFLFFQVFFFW